MGVGRHLLFFFQAEDGIRDLYVTGVQTCALPVVPFTSNVHGDEAELVHDEVVVGVALQPADGIASPGLVGVPPEPPDAEPPVAEPPVAEPPAPPRAAPVVPPLPPRPSVPAEPLVPADPVASPAPVVPATLVVPAAPPVPATPVVPAAALVPPAPIVPAAPVPVVPAVPVVSLLPAQDVSQSGANIPATRKVKAERFRRCFFTVTSRLIAERGYRALPQRRSAHR